MREKKTAVKPQNDGRRSIQSVETGFPLLAALVDSAKALTLRDLAAQAGMTSAKAHPYLVSFTRVGLVQQDPATGQYELGPFALQMGLVSLQRLDTVRAAMPEVNQLAGQIGHTLAIAVLGSHGPTMIHISEASYPVHVNMRKGTVMSMLHTATGHVFAAWLPPKIAQHYIERETGDTAVVTSISPLRPSAAELDALLSHIRQVGVAQALGNPLPGIDALSVPVFDHSGNIALALTSLGPATLFDASPQGPIATALKECAAAISEKLGYRPSR
ncbi:IclR family transcriptional regulator [Pollutimonas bauzanensis]|jgi:DNA-binding IclR family transcriptional regulator|uniref:IclR family transcriptional regulator n=1 Tax=Pollutimonas bauzanensis TaxID=658167 RepID=UPI003342106B